MASAIAEDQNALPDLYVERLPLLVRKSPLSHHHIAMVLEDMLDSDAVVLWQLMGTPVQSAPFEELLGEFMERLQALANADARVRQLVRKAIERQLSMLDGRVPAP